MQKFLGGPLRHSPDGLGHVLLLGPQIIGACVNDYVSGGAEGGLTQSLQGLLCGRTPDLGHCVFWEEPLLIDVFPVGVHQQGDLCVAVLCSQSARGGRGCAWVSVCVGSVLCAVRVCGVCVSGFV